MRRLLLQAIFLTFGLIANLYIVGDVSAELVCGALLAICCAAVGEYARSSAWTIAISCRLAFAIAEHAAIRCDANHDGHRTMGVDHSRSGDLGPLP